MKFLRKGQLGRFSSTPVLDSFSRDLTGLAARGELDPVIGRDEEISHLIMVLSRRTKNNAVLVGKAGVGKTTIVEGLAQKIAKGAISPHLRDKRVLALDINALLAGTKYRGEFEQRMESITKEIFNSQRHIILFIDEIQDIIEAESSGESLSVSDVFKPAMARGELQMVGATTPKIYDQFFERDPAFERRMQPIFISEPDEQETIKILEGIKGKYEKFHNVKISSEAIQACVEKSKNIMPERSFPDKAIDLMDEAASKARMEIDENKQSNNSIILMVTEKQVAQVARIALEYSEAAKKDFSIKPE